MDLLAQSAVFLVAAVVAVPLFKRLGLGSVLGFIAAGMVIGPLGFGLVEDVHETMHFAELGVVFLLFIIGLELRPSRLWAMRSSILGLGLAQVAVTTFVITAAAWALQVALHSAFFLGMALSLSSTAFALQLLAERSEITSRHGRSAFSVLLFQDIAVIPILAMLPLLAGVRVESERSGVAQAVLTLGVVVGLILAGRFLLRPLLGFVARARSHEVSIALALLVVVGTALLVRSVGLSMALGAFMAGVLLAESEYRHELEANIEPFKGLLLGLFFMAVGMSANLSVVVDAPVALLAVSVGLVVAKIVILLGIGSVSNLKGKPLGSFALVLSQGGEFAFVIFGEGLKIGLMTPSQYDLFVVAVTLSMVSTPLLFSLWDRLTRSASEPADAREYDRITHAEGDVIIAGFGRYGQIVGRVLRTRHIPFTALEKSPEQVDFVRRFGNKIFYGDAARLDLLRAAGAERARVFVLAIDDAEASMEVARVVRQNFPNLRIFARARNRTHAMDLRGLGVELIERETYHSSLQTAGKVLEFMGLSRADAQRAVSAFREHDERVLEEQLALREDEEAMVAHAKKANLQLEQLFEKDRASA
ncbi:MAG: glutathione-regulated potassium-efflux system protein KefB [Myxococcales bacterium]|nr:glutathione-regulated potassium-efflux system protein KefB [Myxococcales bacterium]